MRDNMSASMIATTTALAPRLRRFACMMYEGVLLFAVVFLAAYLFDTLTQSRHALTLRHARQAFLFLAIGVYFVLCWRMGGQTLSMKTWHIKLGDVTGQPPGLMRLAVRYVLCWPLPLAGAALIAAASRASGWPSLDMLIVAAPFLNFLWTWVDREQLFLHDRLLDTRLYAIAPRTTQPETTHPG